MEAYCNAVRRLKDKFDGLELNHIARKYNEEVDELTKIASGRTTVPPNVFARDLAKPSVDFKDPAGASATTAKPSVVTAIEPLAEDPLAEESEAMETETEISSADEAGAMQIDEAPSSQDWRDQYLNRINRGVLPSDRAQARRIARRAKSFILIDDELYKRSPSGVLQHCIPILEGKELLRDIHTGVCGHHAAPRTLVGNAFRQGFYRPTAVADATEIMRTCEGCQFYARKTHLPTHALQTIPITWPFAVWGLDLFTGKKFLEFCDDFHIRVDWSAVAHPQTNGQIERANGMILQGLKPRIFNKLNKFGRRWLMELPSVIWSLRTTPSRATGFTLFFLVYGVEAVLPTDLEYGSPRLKAYQQHQNQQASEDSLDQVDEAQDVALLHLARYQQSQRRYQAQRVRHRDLNKGDLVLRLRQDSRGRHKLTPP
ncbi:uncharacterized protein LOC120681372 [Panicum virgatum]|uniref:uncharacterized protein LOC120681372 n=1 Tax=Panicum virgatum TaxID=38727 RepID=UPI0019D567D5|nr:uncharacterized protein LOC120681372 [Panicum virgatum]